MMQKNSQFVLGSVVAVLIALSLGIGIYYLQPQASFLTTTITNPTTTSNNAASGNAPYLTQKQLVTAPTNNESTLLLVLLNLGNTSILLKNIVLLENSSTSSNYSSSLHLIVIAEFGVTGKGMLVEYGIGKSTTSSANLSGLTIVPSGITSSPTSTCTTGTDLSNENGTTAAETVTDCGLSYQGGVMVLLYLGNITTSSGTTFVAVGGQQYILELEGNFGSEYVSVTASYAVGANSTS